MFSEDPGSQIAMCSKLWEQIQNRSHRFKSATTYCNLWEQIAIVENRFEICGSRFKTVPTDANRRPQIAMCGCRLQSKQWPPNQICGDRFKTVPT